MFSKKIRLETRGKSISVATALVLLAINELIQEDNELDWVYGYQIMVHLREAFNWINVKSGTIYPILKKLNKDNLIRRSLAPVEHEKSKRQTIYYKITPKGKTLVKKIEELNDEALDLALTSSTAKLLNERESSIDFHDFPSSNLIQND